MGLSGYSSVHWPPGAPSESTTWQVMPSRPNSNTWNSPQGPAPMISTSVTIGGFAAISDKPFSLGSTAVGGPDCNPALPDRSWGRLLTCLYVNGALVRKRFEPEDAVVTAHAALIHATERQLAFQVMGEETVDGHAAR